MKKISAWSKRINVFISYQHIWNQKEKNKLMKVIEENKYYLQINDISVWYDILQEETWDRQEVWDNEKVTEKGRKILIQEKHLKYSDVTIILVNPYTKDRHFVDWEVAVSRMQFGSLDRRKKPNGIVILLDNKFIKYNNYNNWFDKIKKIFVKEKNDFINYANLITEENVGKRIYNYVKNHQAVVLSFDEAIEDILKLKAAVTAANIKSKNIIRNFDDQDDIPIMTKNKFRLATSIYTWVSSWKKNENSVKTKTSNISKNKQKKSAAAKKYSWWKKNESITQINTNDTANTKYKDSLVCSSITNENINEFEKNGKTFSNNPYHLEKSASTSKANFL